jgi:CO/xanthine dehydrogenase Mo-binding subunit/aerobic-type carbon monoxide dehydrogenase small subunit (CoxS/CutS family)
VKTTVALTVNGERVERAVDSDTTLLRFLREDLSLVGTKNGCEKGHCGTCTVIVDGEAKRSCLIKMGRADGMNVQTIESLGGNHPIQEAFLAEGAVQCGFCTPGMVLAAKALLDKNPAPSAADVKTALKNNLCRCTGYAAIERAVLRASRTLRGEPVPDGSILAIATVRPRGPAAAARPAGSGVGVSAVRKDGPAKVAGAGVFADDLPAHAPLIGKLLFSEHAHARIISLDVSEASASEGVELVLTAADVPGRNAFGLFVPQQPVLCADEVMYLGDVVAAVFARTREQAEAARAKIRVVYEVLPARMDPEANFAPSAPLFHPDTENNVVHHVAVRKGDAAAGFEQADVIVEGVYETQAVEHAYLEPEAGLAVPDGSGGVAVWTGNQGSEEYRDMIAESLAVPKEKVRVVLTACGGGFGGKEEPAGQIHAALAALKTGKSAKVVLTREESIRTSTKRHPMRIRMRHGATKDGRIVAMTSRVIADAGAYISQSKPVIFRSAVTATGPYAVESVEADSYGIYTHKNPSGAFRGFGSTQASFACEIQMDKLARALDMSPVELRRKNGFREGSITSTGQKLMDGIGYLDTLDAVSTALESMRAEFASRPEVPGKKIGFGVASAYKNVGIGTGLSDHAGAIAELLPSGRLSVRTGAADIGQGSDTLAAQIAAEVLGFPYDLIDVTACDTAVSPDGGMTTGSRQTFVTGNAVKGAAEKLRESLGPYLPAAPAAPEAYRAAYEAARAARAKTRADFTYYPPKTSPHRVHSDPKPGSAGEAHHGIHYSYCFASAVVAVEVDTETGAVKVLKVAAAQDVGRALNPASVRGQIEGAVAMGIGYALSEEFLANETTVLTDSLHKLGVPKIADLPPIDCIIVEDPQTAGPFGAKGIGEVGLNPIAPAISNAIFDAVGVRIQTLPMKKEKVREALALVRKS